jgi:hypothetical protein
MRPEAQTTLNNKKKFSWLGKPATMKPDPFQFWPLKLWQEGQEWPLLA